MFMPNVRRPVGPKALNFESKPVWDWTEALATARPGWRYRVSAIPFSVARKRCYELGCEESQILTCSHNSGGMLVLERADGRKLILERELAWFIQAETYSPSGPH